MQALNKENAALHATCATEKAAHARSLLEGTAIWGEEAALKKRIEELLRRLAEELSVPERSVGEKVARRTQWPL